MASLIAKADIEAELQISLPSGYTADIVSGLCDDADAELKFKTNRTTFTGYAARRAKRAELLLAIDYLAASNRDLMKAAISSLGETGSNISFANGKNLASYRQEAESIISDLKLSGTPKHDIMFADPNNEHTGNEGSILY